MINLIDADIVAYRCAASCRDGEGPDIANMRASRLMQDILRNTGTEEYRAFLSGQRNWRKDLYPEYKANRKDMKRPEHLYTCRDYLIAEWDAEVSDGIEADDDIGIAHTENPDCIISSIDKDFKQLGGKFHDFVKGVIYEVSPVEGLRYFYQQVLLGDKSDNVPGYDGKPRQKPTRFIQECFYELDTLDLERDMYSLCLSAYEGAGLSEADLLLHGKLLYIWRKNPDEWQPPK